MTDEHFVQAELPQPPVQESAPAPFTCLGQTFAGDEERRAHFGARLRQHLQDPDFRAIEGFPIGRDEDILALSDPPYDTACPNPFLPEIIAEWQQERAALHAQLGLRDEEYRREPFAADVSEGKNDPIYNAHSYHTKVPHKAIMRYLLHYTEPGDIVFDGFCGSGMTGVAAQLCGDRKAVQELGYRVDAAGNVYDGGQRISRLGARKAVLNDLSPAATFIAYNYNTPVDVAAFEREARRILAEVDAELGWMYETWHPHCDDPNRVKARINYTVWSEVCLCPICGNEFVLWDVAVDPQTRRVRAEFTCPGCSGLLRKADVQRSTEVVLNMSTGETHFRAKRTVVLLDYRLPSGHFEKRADADDHAVLSRIESRGLVDWHPTRRIDQDIDLWYERDYRSLGIHSIDQFYTHRNLIMASALWRFASSVSDQRIRLQALCWLQSVMMGFSLLNRYLENAFSQVNRILSGTLYIGSYVSEVSPHYALTGKIRRTGRMAETSLPAHAALQVSAARRSTLPANSIDYIFIDPPFGSNIIYSDLSIVWESWLRLETNTDHETVVHRRKQQGKTLADYQEMMTAAFTEMHRVLKAGHWMTIEFHNTNNAVWRSIQEAIGRAGFVVADVRILDKRMASFKQVTARGTAKQDLVITAYKPLAEFERAFALNAGTEDGVWDFVRQHLRHLPVAVQKNNALEVVAEPQNYLLFDRMVAYHIQRGVAVPMGAAQFYAGLQQHFVARDGMYFLPEQVAEYDRARLEVDRVAQISLFVNDEKSAITWLRVQLDREPQTFQTIQPRFLQELHQARHEELPDLRVLLEENFLQDSAGRWYVPDPNKAEDLEKLRLRGLLREFAGYEQGKKTLKVFRSEAVRAGFAQAWRDRDYKTIVQVAERLPEAVLQEDPDLLMYYDNASLRM